ncbi:MAG: cytochrome B [Gammaproteobacteria bacterium]|nr:cytochrome B [Gammaproteobacteria bacterium]
MIEHPRPLAEPRLAAAHGAQPALPQAPPKAHSSAHPFAHSPAYSPAPPAPPTGNEAGRRIQDPARPARVLIWDWPVRIGHWALAALFILAWLTGDSEEWRLVHATLGGALLGLVLFRLLWGFMGSYHARFGSFVRSRQAVFAYVRGLLSAPFGGKVEDDAGHNAAAGWAILAMLTLGLLTAVSGWIAYQGEEWEAFGAVHEFLATAMLWIVIIHVLGVLVSSLAHGENLIAAMFTGYKRGRPEEAITRTYGLIVPLVLAWSGVCAWLVTR